jgi:hypothetical protein
MKRTVLKFGPDADGWETLYKREEVTTVESLDEFNARIKALRSVLAAAEQNVSDFEISGCDCIEPCQCYAKNEAIRDDIAAVRKSEGLLGAEPHGTAERAT